MNGDHNYVYYTSPTGDCSLIRETHVYLVCDQSATNGKETLTTSGDSSIALVYVSRCCYNHVHAVGI